MTITNEEYAEILGRYAEEIVSLRKRLAEVYETPIGKSVQELADLRAYKERTEAGLVDLSGAVTLNNRTPDDGSHHAFLLNTITWKMRRNGLWRDPPQAEVQP